MPSILGIHFPLLNIPTIARRSPIFTLTSIANCGRCSTACSQNLCPDGHQSPGHPFSPRDEERPDPHAHRLWADHPDLITGSIFIEAIFRVPGLDKFWVTSAIERDYPMIIGLTVLWSVLIALTYLITDMLYVFAHPRVKYY
ncbi:MAG: ABC transporter permease subunit [Anaerolineae bacterium]|nr:MAG: ABC transporter permease subunit [Anaerolineae bacterium]